MKKNSKEDLKELKCEICKVSKTDLRNFIVKNNYDNNYLEIINFMPALRTFANYHKENPQLYSQILGIFFSSGISFCSKKCYGIYNIRK